MNQLCSVKVLAVSRGNEKCLCEQGSCGDRARSVPVENQPFLV